MSLVAVAGASLALSGLLSAETMAASLPREADLFGGMALGSGMSIASPDGRVHLTMQTGGDLVATIARRVVWSSHTSVPGAEAIMLKDGNFVVKEPGGHTLWQSGTAGDDPAWLSLDNDGVLALTDGLGTYWSSATVAVVAPGEQLLTGLHVTSPDGTWALVFQSDGNLVEYPANGAACGAVWASHTAGAHGTAVMQQDGNLVVYASDHHAQWSTGTFGNPGADLRVRDDGSVTVDSAQGRVLWATQAASLRSCIASVALAQTGYRDLRSGGFCNKFSAYWAKGTRCSDGTYSEPWCADFAAWAWQRAGIPFTYGFQSQDINAGAVSFYLWAVRTGRWRAAGSGYVPQAGDIVVFGLNAQHTSADHVGVVISSEGYLPDVVNGDWGPPSDRAVVEVNGETTSDGTDGISGYALP